jgi:hypothetical protein
VQLRSKATSDELGAPSVHFCPKRFCQTDVRGSLRLHMHHEDRPQDSPWQSPSKTFFHFRLSSDRTGAYRAELTARPGEARLPGLAWCVRVDLRGFIAWIEKPGLLGLLSSFQFSTSIAKFTRQNELKLKHNSQNQLTDEPPSRTAAQDRQGSSQQSHCNSAAKGKCWHIAQAERPGTVGRTTVSSASLTMSSMVASRSSSRFCSRVSKGQRGQTSCQPTRANQNKIR